MEHIIKASLFLVLGAALVASTYWSVQGAGSGLGKRRRLRRCAGVSRQGRVHVNCAAQHGGRGRRRERRPDAERTRLHQRLQGRKRRGALEQIGMDMPWSAPGSLQPGAEYADVMAYVLGANKYPHRPGGNPERRGGVEVRQSGRAEGVALVFPIHVTRSQPPRFSSSRVRPHPPITRPPRQVQRQLTGWR